jgi:hypothetical protein
MWTVSGDLITTIVLGSSLTAGALVMLWDGSRSLVTGRLTSRASRMAAGRRGGLSDPTAIAVWEIFWGVGFAIIAAWRLVTASLALGLTGMAIVFFGSILALMRDRYAKALANPSVVQPHMQPRRLTSTRISRSQCPPTESPSGAK